MKKIKLVSIVSSYNRLSLLQVALPSLLAALQGCSCDSAVTVFDAGSTDGSKEWLAEYISNLASDAHKITVDVIGPDEGGDSSFSAGVNRACQFAGEKYPDADRYFFFETDNWISSSDPLELACALLDEDSHLGAVGFTVAKYSGEPAGFGARFPTVGQFVLGTHLTFLLGLESPKPHWQKFRHHLWTPCDVVFTSPLLVRRAVWEKTGGFDSVCFPFSDCDTDWCYRLAQAGWIIAVLDQKGVVHDNRNALSGWSARRALQFHRARLSLLKRRYGAMVNLIKPFLFIRHLGECVLIWFLVLLRKRPVQLLRGRLELLRSVFYDYSAGAGR